jgi:PilZ domain
MSQERRDTTRKHTFIPAFLFTSVGAPLGKCFVKDISERGARLVYSVNGELPDQLLLTMGMERQYCRVMWRRQKEIGVQFGARKA